MEEAAVIMVGLNRNLVLQSLEVIAEQGRGALRFGRIPPDYDVANVSQKVLRIILSYVDYVNSVIWRKPPASPDASC
jgi:UDP-N-acetylglucosamine 2-epimerase (non-hydrolysing)